MNDPELDEPIRDHLNKATHNIRNDLDENPSFCSHRSSKSIVEHREPPESGVTSGKRRTHSQSAESEGLASVKEHLEIEEDDEVALFQPTLWWFTSTAFPLIAGTFGPIANLFSVCALAQTWRVRQSDGGKVHDPAWIIALNTISLAMALAANIILLLNFARRIGYTIAQSATIVLWYSSSIILVPPLILTHTKYLSPSTSHFPEDTIELSQSYYYGLIASALYFTISTLLLVNLVGAHIFRAYSPSFGALTMPQRTLMLQTIVFSSYLALGGGVFAKLETWSFVDGLYWAEYTLLTIGLGSDFSLKTTGARMLLIPFAAFGIVLVGIIVGSVRGLVLERAKVKVGRRRLEKERERKGLEQKEHAEQDRVEKKNVDDLEHKWRKAEFALMREVERKVEKVERYTGLAVATLVYVIVWISGSLVFWATEGKQWTYPSALYFTYTTITTIGYGDLYPTSQAGRPFFVFWTLLAVPAVTILVSHMGSTVVRAVSKGVELLGRWTVLPEPKIFGRHHDHHQNRTKGNHEDRSGKKDKNHEEREHREGLSADVEHLGSAITHAEEAKGRGDSLPARLAREIRNVSRDIDNPRQYEWDEWVRWLELLCEDPRGGKKDQKRQQEVEGDMERETDVEEKWIKWSWLSGDGPLMSTEGETQWVLGKLCERLEEVLELQISNSGSK
ncbi:hypothetical protein BDQ17DRAFT_1288832 [Cyathus striatus]|nr:hypothetical protein BDQ17DRAFT_1288832 [Cyathus striatus]